MKCQRCFTDIKEGKYCSDKCRIKELEEAWRRLNQVFEDMKK